MYNGVGVPFADFRSFFLNHFHRIFKNGGQGRGFKQTPSVSATGLFLLCRLIF